MNSYARDYLERLRSVEKALEHHRRLQHRICELAGVMLEAGYTPGFFNRNVHLLCGYGALFADKMNLLSHRPGKQVREQIKELIDKCDGAACALSEMMPDCDVSVRFIPKP